MVALLRRDGATPSPSTMRDIDGSYGEGGGQLVRTACALSAITGAAIRLHSIRARRAPAGLAPQHLAAVKAVAAMCDADVTGLELGAREIAFRPRAVRGGEYRFDVGTAGSISLVLQAALPVAMCAAGASAIHVTGGTDIRAAPPIDYVRHVLVASLARLGADVQIETARRGYYPRGGGAVTARVTPQPLRSMQLDTPGALRRIRGIAHVANLPAHIVERMQQSAQRCLTQSVPVAIERQVLTGAAAVGQGGAIVLWAETEHTTLGAAAVAQRGVPAEKIGATAAAALRAELACGATLDVHAADQLLIYMAQAPEASRFRVHELSSHARTTCWLLEQFWPLRIATQDIGDAVQVQIGRAR
jgi:RNA 3'-phosphate cyclase